MGKRGQQQQNKRSFEQVEQGDELLIKTEPMESSDTNNNAGNKTQQKKSNNMKKQQEQAHVKHEDEEFEDADDEEQDDEEDVIEEEEEIEEEVEEEEDDEDEAGDNKQNVKSSSQGNNQASSGQQNSSNQIVTDKRPRLTDDLFEMNLRRKKEHVCSALYIPFPRKVTEEEVRNFVGQGPNIFLVGLQKQNAIVRYRTQEECEKQQKELAKKEFDNQTLNIEPKTVKIDPANVDVKTLIVQYSNPDLTIMDFAQIFIKAISISLKGGKTKRESQEDLSFGSAIIIFPSHDEAKEAFLATENLNIKGEQLRVVFADFRPSGSSNRPSGFRNKGGENNRGGNFNRGGRDRRDGGGNFRNRNRQGGNRNYGNRNFNSGSGGGGGGNYNQGSGGGRNYSPNKKFRPNVR